MHGNNEETIKIRIWTKQCGKDRIMEKVNPKLHLNLWKRKLKGRYWPSDGENEPFSEYQRSQKMV